MKKQFLILFTLLFVFLLFPISFSKAETSLGNKLKGKLLLQVEQGGRIWYVNPTDGKRFEVTFENALPLFQKFALGISDNNLKGIPQHGEKWSSKLGNQLKGKLLLQVEQGGRIWYVDFEGKRWEITFDNLMTLFKSLALGITNDNLNKIEEIQKEEKIKDTKDDSSSNGDINKIEASIYNPPINLINNKKWNIFIKSCESEPSYVSDCLYFNVYRNNEDMSVETYQKNKYTGEFEKYYADYSARFYETSVPYLNGNIKEYKKDIYLSVYRYWYEYPSIKVNFETESFYIPTNITQEKLSSVSYRTEEYGDGYMENIDLEIKIRQKENTENDCLVKGFTNYKGKFYYTNNSSHFNGQDKFKCFSNEKDAQGEGYIKSYDN